MKFNQSALRVFDSDDHFDLLSGARSPKGYLTKQPSYNNKILASLPQRKLNRRELMTCVRERGPKGKWKKSAAQCMALIFCWGGMHKANFNKLDLGNKQLLQVVRQLRKGGYSRGAAYDAFAKLRNDKIVSGLGPAYFTKLIDFLMPGNGKYPRGLIMDQWVARSVNLILETKVVRIYSDGNVSKSNSGQNYEKFCSAVEDLANFYSLSPSEMEFRLFSRAGQPWRLYVKKHG